MNWILWHAAKPFPSLETGTLVPQRHNVVNWVIYYRDMVRTVTPSNSTHLIRFTCHLCLAVAERLEVNTSLLSQSPSANTPDNPRSMRRSFRGGWLCFRWWVQMMTTWFNQCSVSFCFKKPSLDPVWTDPLRCHDSGHGIEPCQSPFLSSPSSSPPLPSSSCSSSSSSSSSYSVSSSKVHSMLLVLEWGCWTSWLGETVSAEGGSKHGMVGQRDGMGMAKGPIRLELM